MVMKKMQQTTFEDLLEYVKTCSLNELKDVIKMIVKRFEDLSSERKPKTRLEELTDSLKDLGISFEFLGKNNGYHLQSLVLKTAEHPIINEYLIEFLKNDKSFINVKDETNGWTALMLAVRSSKNKSTDETVTILLDHGADFKIIDHDGNDALDHCIETINSNSSLETLEKLIKLNQIVSASQSVYDEISSCKDKDILYGLIGLFKFDEDEIIDLLYYKYQREQIEMEDFINLFKVITDDTSIINEIIDDRAFRELFRKAYSS